MERVKKRSEETEIARAVELRRRLAAEDTGGTYSHRSASASIERVGGLSQSWAAGGTASFGSD